MLILIFISTAAFAQSNPVVEITESMIDDISLNELITGSLSPVDNVNLPAETGGVAAEVNVEIGDQVEAEQLLIKIDDEALMIQKRQAEAALDSAQANYQELKNGATEEELARVKSSYQNAKDSLKSAETNLRLMQELFNERRTLEQQLVSAEQQLDTSKQNLNQAEVNYNQAKRDFERSKTLYQDNVISKKDYEDSESALKNARTAFQQAKNSLLSAEKNYQLTKEIYNNPTELKQQLENARSQLNNSKSNLEVAKANLKETKRGPRSERVRAGLASVKQAEANLNQIEDKINKTEITAPFSGVINQVNVEEGEMIGSGQTVINLMNLDQLYAEIDVTARTASTLKKGDTVGVKAETMQHYLDGTVSNIAPAADPSSRTFLVKVKIPNKDHKLRAGMFADVKISIGNSGSAVVVPIESIVNLNNGEPYLFLLESGKAVKKNVEIGINTDSRVEILSGLEAGKDVIIRGQSNLQDGQEVEVRNQ